MNSISRKKGFTLIEILVVIGIIAILAAIVLIAINPARQFAQARQTQRTSNVNAILNAVGQFVADNNGDLPSPLAIPYVSAEIGVTLCDELVPTYLPSLQTDPNSGLDGEIITVCADATAGQVDYFVEVDAVGRTTICAPNAALETAIEGAEEICVTR